VKFTRVLVPFLSVLFLFAGCSNIPKEAVDLSYQIGQDTESLHQSYRKLIRLHFDAVRQIYEDQWTEKVLVPYVKSYVEETRLSEIVAGKIVWDAKQEKFVEPTPGRDAVQFMDTMQAWSKEFSETTQQLRKDFMAPVEKAESDLIDSVDEAFAQVARGNVAISAHLASLRHVQDSQDELLDKAGMKDVRQKVAEGLAKASEDAANFSGRIESATKKAEDTKKKLKLK
jgi:hypothetical protein